MKKIILIAISILVWQGAWAEDDPEHLIKYRKATMKALGGHLTAATQIVKGRVSMPEQLEMHAVAIVSITGNIKSLFGEGTDFGETRAKENIWEQWEAFGKVASDSANEAKSFRSVVRGGDLGAAKTAIKPLAKSCNSCHKKYREEE